VLVSVRATPMRFTGFGHAGRGNATPKLVVMSPSRPRWGWPPALALLGTILDFAQVDSNPADPAGVVPLVIRSDTRQPRLARARGAHRSAQTLTRLRAPRLAKARDLLAVATKYEQGEGL